jgi:hypothetical protein
MQITASQKNRYRIAAASAYFKPTLDLVIVVMVNE